MHSLSTASVYACIGTPQKPTWGRNWCPTSGSASFPRKILNRISHWLERACFIKTRETHPTEGIRRRKFKVQCARPAPGSRSNIVAGAEKSRPTFLGNEGMVSSRQVRGAPLFQPVHRLHDHGQRFEGMTINLDPSEEGSSAAKPSNGSGVRRGGRIRMTIHSNLAEDKIASAAFRSQDEDPWCWGDPADLGGRSKADGEIPPRFRTSEVAPWGSGAQPLMKVADTGGY